MKIYVVTKGCYSDYHIITATTDEKLAYKIKEKFNGDGYVHIAVTNSSWCGDQQQCCGISGSHIIGRF